MIEFKPKASYGNSFLLANLQLISKQTCSCKNKPLSGYTSGLFTTYFGKQVFLSFNLILNYYCQYKDLSSQFIGILWPLAHCICIYQPFQTSTKFIIEWNNNNGYPSFKVHSLRTMTFTASIPLIQVVSPCKLGNIKLSDSFSSVN